MSDDFDVITNPNPPKKTKTPLSDMLSAADRKYQAGLAVKAGMSLESWLETKYDAEGRPSRIRSEVDALKKTYSDVGVEDGDIMLAVTCILNDRMWTLHNETKKDVNEVKLMLIHIINRLNQIHPQQDPTVH